MKTIAIALLMMFSLSALAADEQGITIQGTYGKTRLDNSFGVNTPTNDAYSLGAGYMWQPEATYQYAQGVMVNVNRYNAQTFGEGSANMNAYDVVYQAEWTIGNSDVAFLYDAGYSLLEAKAEKGGPEFTSNGITGSVGLGYKLGQTGATMVFVEAQGARYFDVAGQGGETIAIMAGNIGVRHRF